MTSDSAKLTIEFTSYWRSGSGASGGGDVDTPALRDPLGLPYVPARQFKGLLREAAMRLEQAAASDWPSGTTDLLFGRRSTHADGSLPAVLDFRDAKLDHDIEAAVRTEKKLAATLFVRLASTKIDAATGAAASKTLRSFEAVVPVTLHAMMTFAPASRRQRDPNSKKAIEQLNVCWTDRIDEAAALVLALGGQRSDGLGRAILSVVRPGEATP